jgi:hypothetical protein
MKSKLLYEETQRFRQWWIWLTLLAVNGLFVFAMLYQIIGGKPFGNNPMSDTGLVIAGLVSFAITLLFFSFQLHTQIRESGIYVRFYPFQLKYRHYPWDSLEKCYVRTYAPVREYGGWGLRLGFPGKGNALNVAGSQGLQLVMTGGKKLLIGTQKPEIVKGVLDSIGQYKE